MLATLLCFGQEKRKGGKSAPVVVLESSAHRSEGIVVLEGRVKNASPKAINGLVLLFDFLGTDGQVITTKRTDVEEEVLEPDAEAAFHVQTPDLVRAVEFRIRGVDSSGRELRVAPAVSKPIE